MSEGMVDNRKNPWISPVLPTAHRILPTTFNDSRYCCDNRASFAVVRFSNSRARTLDCFGRYVRKPGRHKIGNLRRLTCQNPNRRSLPFEFPGKVRCRRLMEKEVRGLFGRKHLRGHFEEFPRRTTDIHGIDQKNLPGACSSQTQREQNIPHSCPHI